MIGIILLNTFIWYSIFTNGFLVTLIWLIVLSAIIGITIKLWEMRIQYMEIIVAILVMACMVSIIIVSYGKQQEKHRKMKEWMKQVKKNNRG